MKNSAWKRSSRCNSQACIERGVDPSQPQIVHVRDSKDPSGLVLSFSADAWRDFIGAIKTGEIG